MKKFTRILQVLMILLLSGSVLYAQNLSNEFNNAKSEKEKNLELLQKKQFVKENASAFQIPGLNEYYSVNTSAFKASPEKQIVKETIETVLPNGNTSALPDKDPTQFSGTGGYSMTDDPALLLCPAGSQLSQDAMDINGAWSFGTSDDNPTEDYEVFQYFNGLGADITSITWWGLLLEYNAGWAVCTPVTKDFIVTVYADDGTGLPDESAPPLYTETVSLTSTPTGELYSGIYEALTWSFVPSPALIAGISEGWLGIQGSGGTTCWFLWLNAATLPGPSCYQWDGTAYVVSDTRSLCLGGDALDHDVACTAIVQPDSGEGLTATETVEISIYNAGANIESFFDVFFQIDGGLPVVETFNGPINPGETLPYIFTATADLSTVGQIYTINACTDLVGDLNPANDCTVKPVENEEPCVVVCPPGATDEGEGIIPDDTNDITNGGCNSDPNVFGMVSCGETVCGSSGFYVTDGSTYRDTDWYVLDLSTYTYPQDVTIEFEAGYTMVGGIVSGPCATAAFIDYYIAAPCEVATVTVTGLAQTGEYWIWMGADFTGDDADWSPYYFTVTCVDAPPPPVNDDMCGAIPIIVDAPPISGDNSYSTVETAWPEAAGSCWLTAASNTIWYSFVAPATGAVQINTDFVTPNDDTQLTLYDLTFGDCTNPSLTQLGCGEDDGATGYGYMAIIDVDGLTPGITYYIQVDGYSTVVGIFDIEVTTQTPCEVVCPPGSLDEAEGIIPDDTFDVTNGGCNSTPEVFGYINCGETMCGTGGFYLSGANTLRDTDWYELDLTGASVPQTVTVVFEAEYDIQGYVFAAPCPVTTSLADYLAGPCEIGTMVAPGLAAGIYYIYMSPDFGGSANWENYYFTVTCEDAAVGPCENSTQYGSATVDPAGALTTISTCNYASEYSPVDGIVLGETYEFTMEDLGTGTWITLRDAAPPGNVLASGPSPLQWTATYSGTVYPHWNLNGYCATDASCHDTWVQCLTCVSYDLDGTVNYFGDTYPMDVITVTLDDGNKTIVATTMTDGSGFYQFTGLAPGAYTLGASTDKPRGGTGLADYGLIISHLLGTQLVGLPYLSADVDNSGDIGLADYGLIVSALLGNYAFLNPDWIYGENLAVVVPTDQTFDFHAICSGDPDGSYIVPPFVPCSVTCPPGSTDEGEGVILDDSFDVTNGGCNSDPNVFGSVVCGETICGSTGFYVTDGSTYRDTDWFVLDLSAYANPQDVTIVFEAGYSVLGGIVSGPCATAAFISSYVAGPCEVATVTATNLAQTGEYWIFMAADFTGNDADWSDYYVTVTCADAAPVIGCEHNSLYPSGTITADATGLVTTISTCNYAGEYSVITGLVIGKTYEIIMSDVGTGAYISVRDGVPPAAPLLEGVSSQFWQATHTDITIHWSLDAACTSDASCHTTTIQCTDCP